MATGEEAAAGDVLLVLCAELSDLFSITRLPLLLCSPGRSLRYCYNVRRI